MTPATLALMTAVGPPDWATSKFPTSSAIKNRGKHCQPPREVSKMNSERIAPDRLNDDDGILQRANARDRDTHDVAGVEREIVGRHHACSSEQHRAVRKLLRAAEVAGQFVEAPLDLGDG